MQTCDSPQVTSGLDVDEPHAAASKPRASKYLYKDGLCPECYPTMARRQTVG